MNRMTIKLALLFLIFGISLSSCSEDCGECFSPPSSFYFNIQTFSGDNLTTTDNFQLNDLEILNLSTDEIIEPELFPSSDGEVIGGDELGWEEGLNIYRFSYKGQILFSIEIDAESVSEDCCSFTVYNSIEFNGTTAENLGDYVYLVQTDL